MPEVQSGPTLGTKTKFVMCSLPALIWRREVASLKPVLLPVKTCLTGPRPTFTTTPFSARHSLFRWGWKFLPMLPWVRHAKEQKRRLENAIQVTWQPNGSWRATVCTAALLRASLVPLRRRRTVSSVREIRVPLAIAATVPLPVCSGNSGVHSGLPWNRSLPKKRERGASKIATSACLCNSCVFFLIVLASLNAAFTPLGIPVQRNT